jgi:hypothetical protein
MAVEHEQGLYHTRLRQRLTREPDRFGVWHAVLQPKAGKAHKRQPVAHPILDPVVREVVKRARNQRLEHQHSVHRLAPCARLALRIRFATGPLKRRPEFLPRHDSVDLNQRVFLGVQAPIAI